MKELATRWDIRITKCENGYRVNWLEEIGERGDTELLVREIVFEEPDTETGELESTEDLLWFVSEHFGVTFSKHNKHNLLIEIVENEQIKVN